MIATDRAGAEANQVFSLGVSAPPVRIFTGTAAADSLVGSAGDDRIIGLAGADIMRGLTGNDVYVVDNARDAVVEAVGEGWDRIESSVAFKLPANVEAVLLTGALAISATGNGLDNELTGNAAANKLDGGAGNDTLDGGSGDDKLNGGLGADTYLFGLGGGRDTISDVDKTFGVLDVLHFGAGIAADQLWFRKVNSNLEVSVIGTADKVTVSGWYTAASHHVEVLELSNGQQLLDRQVQNLVQAMASFTPPAAGQTSLPPTYQSVLAPVVAANWH